MSLTIQQMKSLLHEIKQILEQDSFDHCVAIHEKKIVLYFKSQKALLICFQEPFLRFHLTQHRWKECVLPFSKVLNQTLLQWKLYQIELLNDDRILQLTFKKGEELKYLICELIPKKANAYLVDQQQHIISTLIPMQQTYYTPPLSPPPPIEQESENLFSKEIESYYIPQESLAEFLQTKSGVETQLNQQLKLYLKGQIKFSQELKAALEWEKLQHEATLLQSNLFRIQKGMTKVTVRDWLQGDSEVEFELDPNLTPAETIAKRFQKSKKLKRAIEPLTRQLEQTHKNITKIQQLLEALKSIDSPEFLKEFCQKNYLIPKQTGDKKREKPIPALPYREFTTDAGLKIWVGKSARDNDQLTFHYANGSDYWLHARDVPGSHVVLHLGKQKEPDEESLKDAIQAALFYSKAKDLNAAEVCVTQCKYVSRFGQHQPGKVQISQHRIAYAKKDANRLKNLKERKPKSNHQSSSSSKKR